MIHSDTINAVLQPGYHYAGQAIAGVSIDTRTLVPGELFVAIKGEQFDGHDYLQQAFEQGAVAAIVDREISDAPLPLLLVGDTTQALGEMARLHRLAHAARVVGITGSCGKTTTRVFAASILSQAGNTLASQGSFNNAIGVPLTLLKLNDQHRYVVQEIGTNNPGEIAALTHIAQPEVAAITLAAPVHLEGLGSVAGVAAEKGAIFSELPEHGVAIINQDDEFADYWRELAQPHRVISFGLSASADVRADQCRQNDKGQMEFRLTTPAGRCQIVLQMLGEHNVMNALVAAALATALSVDLQKIQQGLQLAQTENRRLVTKPGLAGCHVIDDSYNANPVAMTAAIKLLAGFSHKRILVFADMGELGNDALQYHRQVGETAKNNHIDRLYCFGELSRASADSFGDNAHHFMDKAQLIAQLKQELEAGATVLVKGSNSMKMNEVAQAIMIEE